MRRSGKQSVQGTDKIAACCRAVVQAPARHPGAFSAHLPGVPPPLSLQRRCPLPPHLLGLLHLLLPLGLLLVLLLGGRRLWLGCRCHLRLSRALRLALLVFLLLLAALGLLLHSAVVSGRLQCGPCMDWFNGTGASRCKRRSARLASPAAAPLARVQCRPAHMALEVGFIPPLQPSSLCPFSSCLFWRGPLPPVCMGPDGGDAC